MSQPASMIDNDAVHRPLPAGLRELVAGLPPRPLGDPPAYAHLPEWILALTYHHSNSSLDLKTLDEFAFEDRGEIGLLYEGWGLDFLSGGRFRVYQFDPQPSSRSPWMLAKIADYWDEQKTAITTFSSRLREMDSTGAAAACASIRQAVTAQVEMLDDELLALTAICVFEDLYRAACAIENWDESVEAYLEASAGTFTALLTERNLTVQYLVTHPWPGTGRPFAIFPAWYKAAGIPYCCPQLELDLRGETDEIHEARAAIDEDVAEYRRHGISFVQLDLDPDDEPFREAMQHRGEERILTLLRDAPPTPGSKVKTWMPKA